jgi:very-short-patch-repair endonuclease
VPLTSDEVILPRSRLDGEPYHNNPRAFENDRIRDAILQKTDIRVLRVTGDRLENSPAAVVGDILALKR